jgi:hypothetical protein
MAVWRRFDNQWGCLGEIKVNLRAYVLRNDMTGVAEAAKRGRIFEWPTVPFKPGEVSVDLEVPADSKGFLGFAVEVDYALLLPKNLTVENILVSGPFPFKGLKGRVTRRFSWDYTCTPYGELNVVNAPRLPEGEGADVDVVGQALFSVSGEIRAQFGLTPPFRGESQGSIGISAKEGVSGSIPWANPSSPSHLIALPQVSARLKVVGAIARPQPNDDLTQGPPPPPEPVPPPQRSPLPGDLMRRVFTFERENQDRLIQEGAGPDQWIAELSSRADAKDLWQELKDGNVEIICTGYTSGTGQEYNLNYDLSQKRAADVAQRLRNARGVCFDSCQNLHVRAVPGRVDPAWAQDARLRAGRRCLNPDVEYRKYRKTVCVIDFLAAKGAIYGRQDQQHSSRGR